MFLRYFYEKMLPNEMHYLAAYLHPMTKKLDNLSILDEHGLPEGLDPKTSTFRIQEDRKSSIQNLLKSHMRDVFKILPIVVKNSLWKDWKKAEIKNSQGATTNTQERVI